MSSARSAELENCPAHLPGETVEDLVVRVNTTFDAGSHERIRCQLWWADDSIEVPTIVAQAVRLRARVGAVDAESGLSRQSIWTDFWLRLITFYPDPELLDSLQRALEAPSQFDAPEPGEPIAQLTAELAVAAATAKLVNSAPPRVHDVAARMLGYPAQRANAILHDNRDLHLLAIQLLRRGDVVHFPYPLLNAGLARSLVVAYGFPPYTDTSGLVLARRVLERNEVVDVISKDVGDRARFDPGSLTIAQEFVATHDVIEGPISFDDWNRIGEYVARGIAIAEPKLAGGAYQRIYSRSMWPASHFLAALIKLRWPSVQWVAEFSDPMRRDVHNHQRYAPVGSGQLTEELAERLAAINVTFPDRHDVYAWTEDLPYQLADELLFTNVNQLDFMTSYIRPELATKVRAKATVEHHPTPPSRLYHRSTLDIGLGEDVVNIGYFGVFYRTRGIAPVIDAIATLPPPLRDRLVFNVFCPDPLAVSAQAAESGISESVVARPYLAYLDFLHVITELDCLLVDDYQTEHTHPTNPYLPSKWSDYVGSGTPIWRLTEPGSVLDSMRSAYHSGMDDIDGARSVLEEIVEFGPRRRGDAAQGR